MVEQFNQLLAFFGITGTPQNFAELVPWLVTVLACMFFAAISGSGPATVSAIGSFMVPAMREKHYGHAFSAALIASAGTIGVIIPPSIPFVIYGVVSGTSIGEMFIAGIFPGIMIGSALMLHSYFKAKKENYPRGQRTMSVRQALREAIWALMVPGIIMGGIYGGIFTPTESAAVASIYALFVGKFIYKELDFKAMYDAFRDAVLVNGATTFMFGLSFSFAAFLTREQIPQQACAWILSISSGPVMTLLIINGILLFVGCFIDSISSMIILTPMMLPIAISAGMDPVHFGLVMTTALAIGFITPPYGANLFVASAVCNINMTELSKAILPFVFTMIVCLMILTYVPSITMALVWLMR